MSDIKSRIKETLEYALNENGISEFERALPDLPEQLLIDQKRTTYLSQAGKTKLISLENNNRYHEIIFKACSASFQSYWFKELGERSKTSYLDQIRNLFNWINDFDYQTTDKDRYHILKDYESYLLNHKGLKISPLSSIKKILREGFSSPFLQEDDRQYLRKLLSLSRPARLPEPDPPTLTNWFSLPWIRPIVGDSSYMSLESPKKLFNSFRITVATTLIWLLEQRELWTTGYKFSFVGSDSYWQYKWCPLLVQNMLKLDADGNPIDELSKFAFLDLIKPSIPEKLKRELAKSSSKSLRKRAISTDKNFKPWQKPIFFHPDYQNKYSPLEELLCSWLAACDAIQPTDIPKLTKRNYARELNYVGRLIAIECTYYKGRAGRNHTQRILASNDPVARALDAYILGLPSEALFSTEITNLINVSSVSKNPLQPSKNTMFSLLLNIWKLESFKKRLEKELRRAGASSIFSSAMIALEHGGQNYNQFRAKTMGSVEEYRESESKPLPNTLFSLTHIKNTAVHARSDQYREADLINHHSHSSLTEKTAYMTDANKEWVNQVGRITRLVLNDLQFTVFQPSISAIAEKVRDTESRTKIEKTISEKKHSFYSIQNVLNGIQSENDIIVLDTPDSALYFIHYVKEAEAKLSSIISRRPEWVERTLIVNIEWMTRTLNRMTSTAEAVEMYSKLASFLPPLFDSILEALE